MRQTLGVLGVVVAVLCAAAPAEAISSRAARSAVIKAVNDRYEAPEAIAVRCHGGSCKVAFRQHLTTCKDNSVHVTRSHRVTSLRPLCIADSAGGDLPQPPGDPGTAPPPTTGPPPPPGGPPPPPSVTSARTLAHASDCCSNSFEWAGWTDMYTWADYPGYWFDEAVFHDLRNCEPYYADFHGVYYWDGGQWAYWYGFWKNWWFGDIYYTDPCV